MVVGCLLLHKAGFGRINPYGWGMKVVWVKNSWMQEVNKKASSL